MYRTRGCYYGLLISNYTSYTSQFYQLINNIYFLQNVSALRAGFNFFIASPQNNNCNIILYIFVQYTYM